MYVVLATSSQLVPLSLDLKSCRPKHLALMGCMLERAREAQLWAAARQPLPAQGRLRTVQKPRRSAGLYRSLMNMVEATSPYPWVKLTLARGQARVKTQPRVCMDTLMQHSSCGYTAPCMCQCILSPTPTPSSTHLQNIFLVRPSLEERLNEEVLKNSNPIENFPM